MNFSHVSEKTYRHDQTSSSFCGNAYESVCLSWNGISRNIFLFHISSYTQVGQNMLLHFWALFGKRIYQCLVVIIECLRIEGVEISPNYENNSCWELVGQAESVKKLWKTWKLANLAKFWTITISSPVCNFS